SNFLWDNTAKSLIINSTTPAGATLYVVASSASQTLPVFAIASTNGTSLLTVSPAGNLTLAGNLTVSGTVTLNAATTTINGATYYWPSAVPSTNKILQSDSNGNLTWVSDQTGGGGSV